MKSDKSPEYSLAREEWDFSGVPDSQSEACFAWEFARECDWLLDGNFLNDIPAEIISEGGYDEKRDEFYHEEKTNPEYEHYLFNADEFIGCICGQMIAENYHRLKMPWQSLPTHQQNELLLLGTPELVGVLPMEPKSYEFRVAFGLNPDSDAKPWFDAAAFRINFNQSDKRLLQDFAAWLKRTRKKPARETRGRSRRDALNMLGAMRLLHRMPLEEAIITTTRALGEPLYGKRSSWERARNAAVKIFREEFLTNPTDDDIPVSFPKFETPPPPEDDF